MDLLSLPVVMIENIISYLSFDEIAKTRVVCRVFNEICQRSLNRGFVQTERRHAIALKTVKSQLPRRESERRMGLAFSSDEFDDSDGDERYYRRRRSSCEGYDHFDDEEEEDKPSDPVNDSSVPIWESDPPPTDLISELPIEIFQKILSYVKGATLSKCAQVSKDWRQKISQSDVLWHKICMKEAEITLHATKAKEEAYAGTTWFAIYRNLKMFPKIRNVTTSRLSKTEFETDFDTTADLHRGILVVNARKMSKLIDINQFKYKPVTINGDQVCQRIANTTHVTVLQVKDDKSSTLYVQRTVNDNESDMKSKSATFCYVSVFHLMENELYYLTDKKVIFKVDFNSMYFLEELLMDITTSQHGHMQKIVEMRVTETPLKVFCYAENGKILVFQYGKIETKTDNITQRLQLQKHGYSICDEQTYIMYNKKCVLWSSAAGLIPIALKSVQHACLHNGMIVLATENNVIQMFKPSRRTTSAMIHLDAVPKNQVIEKLRVCETNAGPIVVVSTMRAVFLLKTAAFYEVYLQASVFDDDALYERLLALRDRLEIRHRTPKRRVLKRKLT